MITTDNFEIKKTLNLTSDYIETLLKQNNISALRWAIVGITDEKYILSVSYIKS